MSERHHRGGRSITIALSIALLSGAFAAANAPVAAAAESPDEVLSHFLCYFGKFPNLSDEIPVQLDDQFGISDVDVVQTWFFCNPAKKKHAGKVTRIVDGRQHLKGYLTFGSSSSEAHAVEVSNQFGVGQPLEVSKTPASILVPTRKRPHRRPRGLDHFACYQVLFSEAIDDRVKLVDQFRRYKRIRVLDPVMHCNPAAKTHGSKTTKVKHPDAHLVCYAIKQRTLKQPRRRWTVNQFERRYIRAKTASMLCVPSTKVFIAPTPSSAGAVPGA